MLLSLLLSFTVSFVFQTLRQSKIRELHSKKSPKVFLVNFCIIKWPIFCVVSIPPNIADVRTVSYGRLLKARLYISNPENVQNWLFLACVRFFLSVLRWNRTRLGDMSRNFPSSDHATFVLVSFERFDRYR